MSCGAVLCNAVRCCVLCRVGECFALIVSNHKKNAPAAQLGPQLYMAHSSAAPCGALPCGVVSCCGFFRTNSSTRYMMRSTRYQVPVGTCFCTRPLAFFKVDCPLSVPMFFSPRKVHPHCRSERGIAHKHTVHSTGQLLVALHK